MMLSGGVLIGVGLVGALVLGFIGAPIWIWGAAATALCYVAGCGTWAVLPAAVGVLLGIAAIRRYLISAPVMKIIKAINLLPGISETERTALEAGHTWADKELFSGKPNFEMLRRQPYGQVSAEEKAFLDHQVVKVCALMDDTRAYREGDMPPEVWEYLKKEKFFGMIIPKQYGGLGFSGLGHSEVVSMLGGASLPLAITVMVPNSLGPAELLVHYGTEEQKNHYLPRLADGREIPCFGLTEPEAGSDAGSMRSQGVLFRDDQGQIRVRLNWEKRWITLGAVSTVIGLAVKLYDPENFLGRGTELGITCFLVPSSTPGVTLGRRHDPLGVPFFNCPIFGADVVVGIDAIVGGADGAGQGWRMLMECLAAGRSISLPAQSVGGAKRACRAVSAYAQVRKQFGMSIGRFEGVGEAMARMGGLTYMIEAMRVYTVGAVDQGLKPSVASAMAKLQGTETGRVILNDAMDVMAGAAITEGPKNVMARWYKAAPIGITVEGANILTRTLIIFGQGAIRCHPYAYRELTAIEKDDLAAFDAAFSGHVGHVVRNTCRALLLTLSRGRLAATPGGVLAPYYRKIAWTSASFALLADLAMAGLGGSLKFREKLTGRFADIFSWMYLITCVLRRWEAEGEKKEDLPFVHYACQHGFSIIDERFLAIYNNFKVPVLGWFLRNVAARWARLNPIQGSMADTVGDQVVRAMMTPGGARDRLTARALYLPEHPEHPLRRLELAFEASLRAGEIDRKVRAAVKSKKIKKMAGDKLYAAALESGVITPEEKAAVTAAEQACRDAIAVDSYALKDYRAGVVHAHRSDADPV